MRFLTLLLLAGWTAAPRAQAQGVQNMDYQFLVGPAWAGRSRLPGTDVSFESTRGISMAHGYGYQLARFSAASLWFEFLWNATFPGVAAASAGGSAWTTFSAMTPGLRLMLPVHSRASLYGAAGFGYGRFHYPTLAPTGYVRSESTHHGVFAFGGGVDIRLSRVFSIRVETRDFVSGRGLSGATGRHHIVPVAGIALHH